MLIVRTEEEILPFSYKAICTTSKPMVSPLKNALEHHTCELQADCKAHSS